jgi:hypothetical protein
MRPDIFLKEIRRWILRRLFLAPVEIDFLLCQSATACSGPIRLRTQRAERPRINLFVPGQFWVAEFLDLRMAFPSR